MDRAILENSLNGIDPETLTDEEIETQERWIEDNWEDLNASSESEGDR